MGRNDNSDAGTSAEQVCLRFYIGIDSKSEVLPAEYVSVRTHTGNDYNANWRTFSTGDFLADWDAAVADAMQQASEAGCEAIWVQCSSTVDWWSHDSCLFMERDPEHVLTGWRRMTDTERAAALDRVGEERADDEPTQSSVEDDT